jgi:ABC-type molybdenum transport system ATPase subunit/photorepair protein PhrA
LLEGEFLPLRQGLTVLYGLNGAGKTRLLRGIRAALTGVRADVGLGMIVRATTRGDLEARWTARSDTSRPVAVALSHAIQATYMSELVERSGYDDPGVSPSERSLTSEQAKKIIHEYIGTLAGDEDADLTAEMLDTRTFLLVPTGTTDQPAWDAWAVADLDLPAAARVHRELALAEEAFNADAPDDFDEMMDSYELFAERFGPKALFAPSAMPPFARGRGSVEPTHFAIAASNEMDAEFLRGLEIRGRVDFGIDMLEADSDPVQATSSQLSVIVAMIIAANEFLSEDEPAAGPESFVQQNGLHVRADVWASPMVVGNVDPSPEVSALIEQTLHDVGVEVTSLADAALRLALPDPPSISLRIRQAALRFVGPPAEWVAGRQSLPLDALSRAEQTWATRVINAALYQHRRDLLGVDAMRPVITIIDEPEAALHRAAESQMATFLTGLVKEPHQYIITATHSPELLDSMDSNLIEVQRGGGHHPSRSLIHTLDFSERDSLNRLGLTPSDLLRWPRVILLVEGVHDEILLHAFLGARLRAARVHVLPLHGGKRLAGTVDSQVLFDFTQATLVGLVDNMRADAIRTVWAQAQEAAARGDTQRAKDLVLTGIPEGKQEAGFIRSWLTRALDRGLEGRVRAIALSARDVVEYLPVDRFVKDASSWEELHRAHEAAKAAGGTRQEFKPWLTSTKRADFSPDAVARAAMGIEPPKEFIELMNMIEALGIRQPE